MKIKWAPVKIPPRRRIQTTAAGLYVLIFLTMPLLSFFIIFSAIKREVIRMKIEWAPVKIPPRRRLQTSAVGLYVFVVFALAPVSFTLMAAIIFYANYIWKILALTYLTYIYYDHKKRHSVMDGNGLMFLRNNFVWKHLRDYFPIELVKTAELTPNRNYILASFPHGVIGTGICNNMGYDIGKWLELFPGVRPKIGTLDMHFYTPIFRELLRWWGLVSVSKESLLYYLSKSNDSKHPDNRDGFTSNAVAILVGGAQEALDSHPGRYILTLKNRKGFVKLAIRTGSPIVPTFSFGEVDIFDQVNNPPDSWLRKLQSLTKKLTGISPLVVMGRGFFQYSFGFLPRRKHIVQVVGAPIDVKKQDDPSPEYVNEVHGQFMLALNELFETHKTKYVENSKNLKLIIN